MCRTLAPDIEALYLNKCQKQVAYLSCKPCHGLKGLPVVLHLALYKLWNVHLVNFLKPDQCPGSSVQIFFLWHHGAKTLLAKGKFGVWKSSHFSQVVRVKSNSMSACIVHVPTVRQNYNILMEYFNISVSYC